RLATAQQHQPAEHPERDQIEQADKHKTRSFLWERTPFNHRSEPSLLNLTRYRLRQTISDGIRTRLLAVGGLLASTWHRGRCARQMVIGRTLMREGVRMPMMVDYG
ncbi:hypothetical protein, partial [Nonomuraea insulae]